MPSLMPHQEELIQLAIQSGVLQWGDFTLKSGRKSTYFFNIGQIKTAQAIATLGKIYAQYIHQHFTFQKDYDMLFGPAYKGIPLVITTSIALAETYNIDVPFCFNRKETKQHGEKGNLIGSPLKGRILLVDDVISAGTAITESCQLINLNDAQLNAVVVALDRQEKDNDGKPLSQQCPAPVHSIISLQDMMSHLKTHHPEAYKPLTHQPS